MKNKILESQLIADIVSILLGCLITAFAVATILVPNNLSTSGITGISLIIEKFTGINYTYIYYVFSISILIATYLLMGKKSVLRIIFVSILYPPLLILFKSLNFVFVQGDMFLVCIYFSIFFGVGGGLVMRRGYTFGGTDTVARILRHKVFKDTSISKIMLVLDAIVIVLSGFVFGREIALYALVNHVISMLVMDYMLFGFRAKLYKVSIISQNYTEITDFIITELKRGVTMHDIVGAYTKEPKKMITCICSPSQSAVIRRFLAENYPNVFMEVSPIVAVYAIGSRFTKIQERD